MKKISLKITKFISLILILISGYLFLFTPSSLKVNNTHQMLTTIISKEVGGTNNSQLQKGLDLFESSGLSDDLLSQIPKKYQWDFSYYDLYQLSKKYNQDGKLEPEDFNLASSDQMENLMNEYAFKKINQKLDQNQAKIKEGISIYQAFFWIVILLYLLAVILLLFNRYFASVFLLLASIGSYSALSTVIKQINPALRDIYSGISIQMGTSITLGLILSIATAVLWWLCVKQIRKMKYRDE